MNLQQLRAILASDEPTDMWLLYEDGRIEAHPETDPDTMNALLDPNTWPRHIIRSENAENLVAAMGEDRALNQINMHINNIPKPVSKGARLGQAAGEALANALKGPQ